MAKDFIDELMEALKEQMQHLQPLTGIEAFAAPSTSPANAAWSLPRLTTAWGTLLTDKEA